MHAGDGGVGAQGLECGSVELPRKCAADFGDGGNPVFEKKTEFHASVAALLVQRVAEEAEKRGQLWVRGEEEPRDLADVCRDVVIEGGGLLDVDARAFGADDNITEDNDGGVFGEERAVVCEAVGEHVESDRGRLGGEREGGPGAIVFF